LTPSTQRTTKGGWANVRALPSGPNGRALCRWCAIEVPRGRRTFCSSDCVHEWKLRTDPGYLREQVFARDRGVCAACGTDTEALRKQFRKLDYRARRQFLKEWKVKESWRRSLWDADHVVPVAEGGGECDLANMRTLCLKCHRGVTAELRRRLGGKS
jgi:5-methylcytosine-specific restriction protein A